MNSPFRNAVLLAALVFSLAVLSCGPTEAIVSVSLDTHELSLVEGDSYTFTATISYYQNMTPDKHVTWESSDEAVVSVNDGGTVYALTVGTASITVITVEGGKTDSCTVTVTPVIEVASVDILSAKEIGIGESYKLTAIVAPADATYPSVWWESDDPTVATVDADGTVYGMIQGLALITAHSGGHSASCTLSVSEYPLEDFSLADTTVVVGGHVTLSATFTPVNATNQTLMWESERTTPDPGEQALGLGAATVEEGGLVTGVAPGTVTITAIHEASGLPRTCTVTVTQ